MNKFWKEKEDFKRKEIQLQRENASSPGPGYYESGAENKSEIVGCKSSFISKYNR